MSTRLGLSLAAVAVVGALACAPAGELAALRYLPNNVPEPQPLPAPSRGAFPETHGLVRAWAAWQSPPAVTVGREAVGQGEGGTGGYAEDTQLAAEDDESPPPNRLASADEESHEDADVRHDSLPRTFAPSQLGGGASTSRPADEATPSPGAAVARNSLSGRLPAAPASISERQRGFWGAATKVYERIFADDVGDVRAVEGVRAQLASDAELAALKQTWAPLLAQANERARKLQRLQGPLGKLRAAFGAARFDAELSVYRDVDMPSCRVAFKRAKEEAADTLSLEVRIEPVGRKPFADFEVICQESHNIALMERDFPPPKGPLPLRNQVRRAYQQAFSGTTVLRISIRGGGWHKSRSGRTVDAVVGVRRADAFPLDECVMEEVSLQQAKAGAKWGEVECCEVETSVAIACEALE